jgi:hypothetical protein
MPRPSTLPVRKRSRFFAIFATLALLAQTGVALAPLTEPGPSRIAAVHVEHSGSTGHYLHNEATCAACQARSIQSTLPHASPVSLTRDHVATAVVPSVERPAGTAPRIHAPPRAPPAVI